MFHCTFLRGAANPSFPSFLEFSVLHLCSIQDLLFSNRIALVAVVEREKNLPFSELRWTVLIHLFSILLLIDVIKQICVFVLLMQNPNLNPLYRC